MSDETNVPNTDASVPPGGQPPAPDSAELGLQDLVAIKSIIDVASSRGAFKPNEMIAVGSVYTKLEKFLEAAAKQNQAAQGQAPNA